MTMTSRNRQVRELLSSISKAIIMSPHPLSAQAVGNCFYGKSKILYKKIMTMIILVEKCDKKIVKIMILLLFF